MIGRIVQRSVACVALCMVVGGCEQAANSNQAEVKNASNQVVQTPPANPATDPAAPSAPQRPANPGAPPSSHDHSRGGPPATPVLGAPPIEFDPPELDLGIVRPNQRVSGTIYIQNISDKWLKILSSKADCTCTSVDLSNTMIAPGERIPMRADYNSSAAMGTKGSAVRVLFEGYDMVEVKIKAFVTMPVKAEPAFISAVRNEQGQLPTSGEYVVESLNKQPFRILAVNGQSPSYVDYDPSANPEPRNSYKLKWDFSAFDPKTCTDPKGNRVPGWMVIETDHPECPVFDMEVRHDCNRRLQKKPNDTWYVPEKRVLIGQMKQGRSDDIQIMMKWYPKVQMKDAISTVLSESSQFTAQLIDVKREADGVICNIKVTPTPGTQGLVYGTLRLHSQNQSHPIVIIGSVTE